MTKQTKLTAINPANEREIEAMFGKAMCAYANWMRSTDSRRFFFKSHVSEAEREAIRAALKSEYEATVRCLDLFVNENLYEIQQIVRDCAEEMMRA